MNPPSPFTLHPSPFTLHPSPFPCNSSPVPRASSLPHSAATKPRHPFLLKTAQAFLKILRGKESCLGRTEQCRGSSRTVVHRDACVLNGRTDCKRGHIGDFSGKFHGTLKLPARLNNFLNKAQSQRGGRIEFGAGQEVTHGIAPARALYHAGSLHHRWASSRV